MYFDYDEVLALQEDYAGAWHVATRTLRQSSGEHGEPLTVLDAAREPGRNAHVIATSVAELRRDLAKIAKDGGLIR